MRARCASACALLAAVLGLLGAAAPSPAAAQAAPSEPVTDAGVAAASAEPGQMDVFVRGQDGHLWTRHDDGASWGPWVDLGGVLLGAPAAVSTGPGLLDVYAIGEDHRLWTRHFDGATWTAWAWLHDVSVPRTRPHPAVAPAATSLSPGAADLFVLDVSGLDIWTAHVSPARHWQDLGGSSVLAPAAATSGPETGSVFVTGLDEGVWANAYSGGWSGWHPLGGILTSAPGAASRGAGVLEVFGRGRDHALWALRYDGGWGDWSAVGGVLTSAPGAVSAEPGTMTVFARGLDGALWANHDPGTGFTGWYTLGGVVGDDVGGGIDTH